MPDFRRRLSRPPILPSLLLIIALGILIPLGNWQVARYQEKIDRKQACSNAHDINLSERDMLCGNVSLTGQFDKAPLVAVEPRMHEGTPGYHIYLPFTLKSDQAGQGQSFFVNLGWSDTKTPQIDTDRTVHVQGRFIKIHGRNPFSMKPEPKKNNWFAFDFSDVNDAFPDLYQALSWNADNVLYADTAIYADDKTSVLQPVVPAEIKSTILKPSQHMQYAFFWFSMALALCVIFVFRFMVKKENADTV